MGGLRISRVEERLTVKMILYVTGDCYIVILFISSTYPSSMMSPEGLALGRMTLTTPHVILG